MPEGLPATVRTVAVLVTGTRLFQLGKALRWGFVPSAAAIASKTVGAKNVAAMAAGGIAGNASRGRFALTESVENRHSTCGRRPLAAQGQTTVSPS